MCGIVEFKWDCRGLHRYVNKEYINKLLKLYYNKEKNYTNGLRTIFVLKLGLGRYLNQI